jgi:DedD protein
MDQGLKERLIGAAVLVALGVWLIPWVLDGPEAQSEIRSAALQLPAPAEPVPIRTQTLRLDEPQAGSIVPRDTAAPEHRTADSRPAAVAQAEPAGDRVTEPVQTPALALESVAAPAPQPVEAAPAAVRTPAAAPATAAAKPPAGSWLVQLGSFSEEENARRLAQRVASFGYKPDISTHRASGRSMYRVRVGPHETRARADAAASALAAHGLVAQVVAAD